MISLKTEKYIYAALSLGLMIYLVLRAIFVPMVHDECATFIHYIIPGKFVPFFAHWDANNHILNSGLTILFHRLFGPSELVLRLANLIFFPLYAVYVFRLSRLLQSRLLQWVLIGCLFFTHSMIEFMALSRGYGMSLPLMIAATYHLLRFCRENTIVQLVALYFFTGLMLVSNLTLTNTALIINGIVMLQIITTGKKNRLKKLLIFTFMGMSAIAGAALIAAYMKKFGLLYYGAPDGFWKVTVQSLVLMFFGGYSAAIDAGILFFFILATALLGISVRNIRINEWTKHKALLAGMLFFGNIAATILLQKLLKVNYPEDRTGMYFYVFLVVSLVFSADHFSGTTTLLSRAKFLLVPLFLFPVHFAFHINLTHSAQWWYEHYNKRFYDYVAAESGNGSRQVSIGGYRIHRLVWMYYNYRNNGALNLMQTSDFPSHTYEYLVFPQEKVDSALQDYTVIDKDEISGLHLMKRKKFLQKTLIRSLPLAAAETADEYVSILEDTSGTYAGNDLYLELETVVDAGTSPFIATWVVSTNDSESQTHYETAEFYWLSNRWDGSRTFRQGIYLMDLPTDLRRMAVYIWNIKKRSFRVKSGLLKIYTVSA